MRWYGFTSAVIWGLLLTGACGRGESPTTVVTRDSAGVLIVESTAPLWAEGEGWRVATEPRVTIGRVDGPEEEQLFRLRGALRLDDGRIVVANGGSCGLRFYDSDGRYRSTVGRAGGGPGEFVGISRLSRVGDSLFVFDFQQGNRMSVFAADGTFVRSFTLHLTPDQRIPIFLAVLTTGESLIEVAPRDAELPQGYTYTDRLVLTYSPEGEIADTLGWLPDAEHYIRKEGDRVASIRRPYGLTALWAIGRDGPYLGSSATFEIVLYGSDGEPRRMIRRPIANPPVTAAERAEYEAERSRGLAGRSSMFRALYEAVELPETKPAYGWLLVDDDNLWVAEYRRRREQFDRWDVFDPDGRWLGTVTTPSGLLIYEIGSDYVLGMRRDEMDVEYVQLYQLLKEVK